MELKIVSFELAKKLKKSGFNIEIDKLYCTYDDLGKHNPKGNLILEDVLNWNKYDGGYLTNRSEELFSAPTLELAKMWFREKYFIDVCIVPFKHKSYKYKIFNHFTRQRTINLAKLSVECYSIWHYTKYNNALEDGLLSACRLLK